MRFVLAVLAVSLQLVLSEGAPATHKDRRSWYGGQIPPVLPESTHNCSLFIHPYCNSIGYATALFPNNRSQNFADASAEFSHFTSLLQSGCSAKLPTLLCFFYFPFCDVEQWQSTSLETRNDFKPVMPCRETCQEVRNNCESVMLAHGHKWPRHLDCSGQYFLRDSTNKCANGTVETKTLTKTGPKAEDGCQGENNDVSSDCPEASTTNASATNEPTEASTTEETTTSEPTEVSTTNEPTEAPTMPCTCPRCDVRTTCTANTFKRNGYTFGEPKIFANAHASMDYVKTLPTIRNSSRKQSPVLTPSIKFPI